jgi:hypothetical protein
MALPLLGLLASQGARTAITKAIQSTALTSARSSRQIASKLKKSFDAQKSKAKIPSQSKLTENLTAQEKNILRRTGLLSDTQKTRIPLGGPGPGQTFPGQGGQVILRGREPGKGLIPYNQGVIPKPKPDYLPIPVSNTNFAAGALGRGQGGYVGPTTFNPLPPTPASYLQMIRQNPIKSGIGLLGTGYLASSFMGEETPQDTIEPVVTTPPTETQPVRFSQLLRPGYDATGKEVLNAALLRAGISLLRGEGAQGALKAAASVSESQNIYKTGSEALEAGRRALGPEAAVEVGQRSDGTFYYRGKFDPTDVLMQPTTTGKEITAEQYQAVRKKILEAKPDATEEDIKDTLAAQGLVYTGV